MAVASAFSPGHITGFVEFPRTVDDPVQIGSRGAGFCISRGVRTVVHAERTDGDIPIFINGRAAEDAEVSRYVIKEYRELVEGSFSGRVEHHLEIPVGYGLGCSGAAALSLSMTLNKALDVGLSELEAAQIAHKADLACRCGLGTVLAEYHGGFEMRFKPGAPGIGVLEKIPLKNYKAVILCMAPTPTREFLANKMQLINGVGGKMLGRLAEVRTVDAFLEMSLQFARSIGFVTDRCQAVIDDMLANSYKCSTAMFGETVFSIVRNDKVGEAAGILARHEGQLLTCGIDPAGARMLDC